jgi:hypothetical protein
MKEIDRLFPRAIKKEHELDDQTAHRRELVEYVPSALDIFAEIAQEYYDDAACLLVKKQADYGPKNISNAPGGPLNGLRVRISDKLARINHLIDSDVTPENESLRDSFIDLANYSIIALMVLDDVWPNE